MTKRAPALFVHRRFLPGLVVQVHGLDLTRRSYLMSAYRNPRGYDVAVLIPRANRLVEDWIPYRP